jgi:hypothetical protein
LTAASTGTPSPVGGTPRPRTRRELGPNPTDLTSPTVVAPTTEPPNREEALKTRITTKINNTVYTENLTSSEKHVALVEDIPDLDHTTIGRVLKKRNFVLI